MASAKINRHTSGELVRIMRERSSTVTEGDAKLAIGRVFDALEHGLAAPGARVRVSGFGTFTVQDRPERQARNPGTGETIHVAAKRVIKFKQGKPA